MSMGFIGYFKFIRLLITILPPRPEAESVTSRQSPVASVDKIAASLPLATGD
jgi:hypothetical protein